MKKATHITQPNILRFIIVLLCCACSGVALRAQQDAVINQWQRTKNAYNPATAGDKEEIHITALYRQQWIGIEGAPANMGMLGSGPITFLGRKHGVGIALLAQKKGLFINTDFRAQYAFQQKLWGGILSGGIELGIFNSAFDGTKVFIPDGEGLNPNDPGIPSTQVSGRAFDTGVGLFYNHRRFYIGVAAKHLLEPSVPLGTNHFLKLKRTYNAMVGYNIIPSETLLSWYPSVLAVTDFNTYRVDISLEVAYAKHYFAGLHYRINNSAGFSVGALWGKFRLGYAFEMPTSVLARGNYGTHEVVVSYAFPIQKQKNKGLKTKSVRLL